jgi:hypothetical protein
MTFQNSVFRKLSLSSYLSEVDHTMGTPDMSMISRIKSRSGGGRAELKLQWDNNLLYTGVDFRHDGEKDVPQQKWKCQVTEVDILWQWDILMHGKTARLTVWDGSMNIRDTGEITKSQLLTG